MSLTNIKREWDQYDVEAEREASARKRSFRSIGIHPGAKNHMRNREYSKDGNSPVFDLEQELLYGHLKK